MQNSYAKSYTQIPIKSSNFWAFLRFFSVLYFPAIQEEPYEISTDDDV